MDGQAPDSTTVSTAAARRSQPQPTQPQPTQPQPTQPQPTRPQPTEQISQRSAEELGCRAELAPRHARRALQWGLAGPPLRTRSALLYDARAVTSLFERAEADRFALSKLCPRGVFVARLGPPPRPEPPDARAVVTPSDARSAGLVRAAAGWELSAWVRLRVQFAIDASGVMPYVATVSGFVVAGADITGLDLAPGEAVPRPRKSSHPRANGYHDHPPSAVRRVTLQLTEPGAWFGALDGRRLPTGPGPSWRLWLPQ